MTDSDKEALSCFPPFATLWTVAHRDPLTMGFSRQEYWSGLPYPPPEDLPDPGIKPTRPSPALQEPRNQRLLSRPISACQPIEKYLSAS